MTNIMGVEIAKKMKKDAQRMLESLKTDDILNSSLVLSTFSLALSSLFGGESS